MTTIWDPSCPFLGAHWHNTYCNIPFFILSLPFLEMKPLLLQALPVQGKVVYLVVRDEDQDVRFLFGRVNISALSR